MVNHTRLDCVLGATAIMRQGTAQAIWHARHRATFGTTLVDQPLMTAVLADLAIESEAATTSAMWLAGLFDAASRGDQDARTIARLATPVLKYWICKRTPTHAAEALECFGGNGFVEESPMPRLFRQSPLNGLWEGSGNVICLDVLRGMARSPESLAALLAECRGPAESSPSLGAALGEVQALIEGDPAGLEAQARLVVERLALVLQGALLVRHAPEEVAEAFLHARLGSGGMTLGTRVPAGRAGSIVRRSLFIDG
ncbi:MAG: acyl-CoA dehydrogenase family protein [Microthrixaceae bacterium]